MRSEMLEALVKFYTEEGNWDLVGNNTPVFFIRDSYKFASFIHTQKRHPQTNLRDANTSLVRSSDGYKT